MRIIPTHRDQGYVLATLSDIERELGSERAQEIERTTPIIKSLAARCVRVAEIEEFSDLAIDEESAAYDMYDLYCQSSNYILATVSMLKIFGLTIEDLEEDSKNIANSLEASEFDKKVLRKNVIELVLKERSRKK